ncbi:MAG: TonB-dependent receptor [PVC group bacterium]
MKLISVGLIGLPVLLSLAGLSAAGEEEVLELPTVIVRAEKIANPVPAGTFAAPVSALRFDPAVDLQTRNIAEAQADCSIRGGIFTQTGFRTGAVTLLDPQTGHYSAEIPISPLMLTLPAVLTGLENALAGFNSTAGTVGYAWRPIETGGEALAGLGDHRLNLEHAYAAYVAGMPESLEELGEEIGFDLDLARSEGDGTRPAGDYDFERIGARLQLRGARSQSDFYGGYQSKFFGWPDMYTPEEFLPTNETESLHTTLVCVNHRVDYGRVSFLEIGASYRQNRDHYVLQRDDPDLYQAFHRTRVWSAGIGGRQECDFLHVNYDGRVSVDDLTSTALTGSPYYSRTIAKFSVLPEKTIPISQGLDLSLGGGASIDDSNRAASAVSPLARVVLVQRLPDGGENRWYCDYAASDQLPDYTALGSPPSGIFGGNPDLGLERSRAVEAGVDLLRPSWGLHAAVFYREDSDLVDWTYQRESPNARTADAVDIETGGGELTLSKKWKDLGIACGYTYLKKSSDYADPDIDASFYALNYPRHRFTAALVARFLEQFEFRSDNEYRIQEPNALRSGRKDALLAYLSFAYLPPYLPGMELTASIDNPFKVYFEEIPGVPGPGRQFTLRLAFRW